MNANQKKDYTGKAPVYQQWSEKDFIFDTMHLNWQARLLYRALLQAAWSLSTRPDIPNDDGQIRNILGVPPEVWDEHKVAVRQMFTLDAERGILWQKRLREDWTVIANYRQKQKELAERRWNSALEQPPQSTEISQGTSQGISEGNAKAYAKLMPAKQSKEKEVPQDAKASIPVYPPSGNGSNAAEALIDIEITGAPSASSASFTSSAGKAPASPVSSSEETPVAPEHGGGNDNPTENPSVKSTASPVPETLSLIKILPKIAARELHNAKGVPRNLTEKFELISEAYGSAAVQMDFTAWCHENRDRQFKYPIVQYVKVIDQRLGSEPKEEHANVKDLRIVELKSLAYKLTGLLPANKAVATVLLEYPMDEIKAALNEYTEDLPGNDAKADMKAFWSDGGAEAIILARRRRNQLA